MDEAKRAIAALRPGIVQPGYRVAISARHEVTVDVDGDLDRTVAHLVAHVGDRPTR